MRAGSIFGGKSQEGLSLLQKLTRTVTLFPPPPSGQSTCGQDRQFTLARVYCAAAPCLALRRIATALFLMLCTLGLASVNMLMGPPPFHRNPPLAPGRFGELCASLHREAESYCECFGEGAPPPLSPPRQGRAGRKPGPNADAGHREMEGAESPKDTGHDAEASGVTDAAGDADAADAADGSMVHGVEGVRRTGDDGGSKTRRKKNAFLRPRNFAHNSLAALTASTIGTAEVDATTDRAINHDDVVLHVQWQHRSRPTKVLEFAVLASQTLAELVDAVYATDRWCLSATVEDHLRALPEPVAGAYEGGGHRRARLPTYMFIEGAFYVDAREKENMEYASTELARFAAEVTPQGQPEYAVKKMEDTLLGDLSLRPGVTYLFSHCGDCEHALVFTQMLRPTARQRRVPRIKYPLQVWKTRVLQRRCQICDIHCACWATYGDPMSRTTPGFFCEKCFSSAHYSHETQEPLFDFKCFRYYHDELQG